MVLKKVALCLKEEADDRITPCRYGGDEFCCICENMTPEEMSNDLKDIRGRLETQNLFHKADEALYWAKMRGKKGIAVIRWMRKKALP